MSDTSVRSQLEQILQAHREDMLQFSRDLIAIPSENPPGREYGACVQRIRQELERLGLTYQTFDAPSAGGEPRTNLLSFVGGGQRTLYFHGHYDVVPAQSRAQFAPREQGGYLYGRGSADMKAGLAAMLYAAYALRQAQVPLDGRVGLCIVNDEETGGQGGSGYLEQMGVLGRDGIGMLTMEPTGGVIWNANRGAISMRVTVRGKAAHVGLQHQGVNAFEGMLRVAAALQELKAEVETRTTRFATPTPETAQSASRRTSGEAAHSILLLGGRVEGGANFNVVPDWCAFTLDRRFNPEEDLEAEKARLLGVLDDCRRQGIALDAEVLQEGHASGVDAAHPVAQALAQTVEAVTGAAPWFEMCPGLLEIRWYARRGIPALAYGPGLLECSHGPDERVEIERVYQHALIYALTAASTLPKVGRA